MKNLLLTLFSILIVNNFIFGQTILNETFDNDNAFTKFNNSSNSFFSDGVGDYFGIAGTSPDFDGSGSSNPSGLPTYTGFLGNYLAGEDLSGDGEPTSFTLTWTGLDISSYSSVAFLGDFAQGTADKIDANDHILVQYQIDGGGYQNLIAFEGADFTSGNLNGNFKEDTDFDGTGDGATLNTAAQTFNKLIAVAGNNLDLKLTISLDVGEEKVGVDNFKLLGTFAGFDQVISSENEPNTTVAVNIPVTLSNYTNSQVDLIVAVTGGTADVSDYTLNTTSLSFTGNAIQNISISINPDADDLDETIEITLTETTATNSTISPSVHTLTILDDDVAQLVITEIHYNPSPDDDVTHEFVEIYNAGGATVNLDGYTVSNAIDYTFGTSDQIASEEYILLVRDVTTYQGNGYQVFDISGVLNNTGETITLKSNTNRVLDEVTYNNSDISATSSGSSYELINIKEENIITATNWQSSAVIGGTPGAANGVTIWEGNASTAWATAGNWSNGVPTTSLNVYIDDGASNDPVLANTLNAFDLFIENGRSLSLGTGTTLNIANNFKIETGGIFSVTDGILNISGDIFNENVFNISGGITTVIGHFNNENNGTVNFSNGILKIGRDFNEGGTLNMTGGTLEFNSTTSDNQKITGTNAYYNLTINNTGGGYVWFLNNNHIVSNTLTLTSGNLNIQSKDLTLTSGGSISGGSSSSYIKISTGMLKMEVSNSDVLFPIGNLTYNPITLNNSGTIDNFSVRILDEITENGASGGTVITTGVVNRMWMIEEEIIGGSDVTIALQWNSSNELTNFDRTNCLIHHYTGGNWTAQGVGANATGSNPYTISATGITTFSPFTVGNDQLLLPVELIFFNAIAENNIVQLTWQTASEQNNKGFEIERSANGVDFENIGFVEGNGTTIKPSDYTFKDFNSDSYRDNYYRLKQVDFDGSSSYSNIVIIETKVVNNQIQLYPNPVQDELTITFLNPNKEKIKLDIYNEMGQLIRSEFLDNDNKQLDIRALRSGVYFVKVSLITNGREVRVWKRFVKL